MLLSTKVTQCSLCQEYSILRKGLLEALFPWFSSVRVNTATIAGVNKKAHPKWSKPCLIYLNPINHFYMPITSVIMQHLIQNMFTYDHRNGHTLPETSSTFFKARCLSSILGGSLKHHVLCDIPALMGSTWNHSPQNLDGKAVDTFIVCFLMAIAQRSSALILSDVEHTSKSDDDCRPCFDLHLLSLINGHRFHIFQTLWIPCIW